ncbi:MAG: M1 family metallopeptidase [Kofleriaceae bacterium]
MTLRGNVSRYLFAPLLLALAVTAWADLRPAPAPTKPPETTPPPPPAPPSDAPIALADPHARAVHVPSAATAWGGARTGQEPTLSDRVVTYDISATLDPVKHTIEGKERLTWRNRSDRQVGAVYLHLYLNAFAGSGSTFFTEKRTLGFDFRSDVDVKEGEWGHIELGRVQQGDAPVPWTFVQPDGGPATDQTVVRLDLPEPVAPGGTLTLDLTFQDQLPRVIARTGYFGTFHLVGQWFPKIGVLELPGERGATEPRWNCHEFHLHSEFYADYGLFDVKLTVPKGFTVGATGEEQGEPVERNGLVTHRFVQGDVHDFAWTADSRTAPPLVDTWTGPGSPEVKVRVLFPPEYRASAAPALQATKDALTYFSSTLGPYPYKTVTVVIPPMNADEAGGMEYPTFFTAIGMAEVPANTLASYALEFVTIHEFGHGYFYGLLGSNEFEEPMLDEGLNDYWDQRMMRARGQPVHLTTRWLRRLGIAPALAGFEVERLTAMVREPGDALGANSWDRLSSRSYGAVYARTATTMHDLEAHLGTEVMERAFKTYYERWKFRHPSAADLRETLAEVSGQRELVERTFAQQVYATQKVDDRIESLTSEEQRPQPGTSRVEGKWVELTKEDADKRARAARDAWDKAHPDAKVGGPFPYETVVTVRRLGAAVPQTLVVTFADGSTQTARWNEDRPWARFRWTTSARAVSAQLDPERQNLLDANKLDDSRKLEPSSRAARRWTSHAAAVVQSVVSLLVTL